MKNVIKTVLFGIMGSGSLVGSAQEFTVACAASYTVGSVSPAEGASSYRWLEDNAIIPGATASSYVNADGKHPGEYMYVRQAYMADCGEWVSSNEFKVRVTGAQATFNLFDPGSAAAGTRWCLTDQRDGKIYRVVKMPNNKIWMAQNLNYQKGLVFNERSNMANGVAFTTAGSGSPTIGSYWCPGVTGDKVSVKEGCDIWGGALYSWETAMSLDGKGTWVEGGDAAAASYLATGVAASAGTVNFGRTTSAASTTGGRGICPPKWHVPTEAEWGDLLDCMETSGTTHSASTASNVWIGAVAGKNAKAAATCPTGTDAACATDIDPSWQYHASAAGLDKYGFRVLPAGAREHNGSALNGRGLYANYWSSSANSATNAWRRNFAYNAATVNRNNNNRSNGFSVRCVRDSILAKDKQECFLFWNRTKGKPQDLPAPRYNPVYVLLFLSFGNYFFGAKRKSQTDY
jgi:uncharacterized protein (TIGR02145 family)